MQAVRPLVRQLQRVSEPYPCYLRIYYLRESFLSLLPQAVVELSSFQEYSGFRIQQVLLI